MPGLAHLLGRVKASTKVQNIFLNRNYHYMNVPVPARSLLCGTILVFEHSSPDWHRAVEHESQSLVFISSLTLESINVN